VARFPEFWRQAEYLPAKGQYGRKSAARGCISAIAKNFILRLQPGGDTRERKGLTGHPPGKGKPAGLGLRVRSFGATDQ